MDIADMRDYVTIVFLCILAWAAVTRNSLWYDEKIIWHDTVAKSPAKLRPVFNLARAYHKAGDLETAEFLYLKASHLFPENPDIYNNLGNIYQNAGRIEEAINLYRTGLQFRETVELYFNLAAAYEKKGDRTSAAHCYRQVLRLDPDDKEAMEKVIELSKN